MNRTYYNLLAIWVCGSFPLFYIFSTTPELRRPVWRLFVLDSIGTLGPWLGVRLLLATGLYLLVVAMVSTTVGGVGFRVAAVAIAAGGAVLTTFAIFRVYPPMLMVASTGVAGLLVRVPRKEPHSSSPFLRLRPELVLVAVGLTATLLQAYPPVFLYKLWRPQAELSTRTILQRHAELDLRINLAAGDYRVVCLSGLGLICPPSSGEDGRLGFEYLERFGSIHIDGTTDAPGAGLGWWLQEISYDYAVEYNRGVFRHVQLQAKKERRPTTSFQRTPDLRPTAAEFDSR